MPKLMDVMSISNPAFAVMENSKYLPKSTVPVKVSLPVVAPVDHPLALEFPLLAEVVTPTFFKLPNETSGTLAPL
jgi:hypothetical protein